MKAQKVTKVPMAVRIRQYLRDDPTAKFADVLKVVPGATSSAVSTARARLRKAKQQKDLFAVKVKIKHPNPMPPKQPKAKNDALGLTLHSRQDRAQIMGVVVPEEGLMLKLGDGVGCIGTLLISRRGVRYVRSNGKVVPTNELTYGVFEKLLATGIIS